MADSVTYEGVAWQGGASRRAALAVVGIGIAELVIFAIGLVMGARGWDVAVLGLALTTALVGLMPIVVDRYRPKESRQLLISLTSLTYMIFLVVPVFTQYFLVKGTSLSLPGTFRLINSHPVDIAQAQLASLTGLLCLLVGFYLPISSTLASFLPRPTREWSLPAAVGIAAVMLPLGWSVYLASQFGLLPAQLGSGALGAVQAWVYWGIALLALIWLKYRTQPILILLIVLVTLSMAFNFFTGSKQRFLSPPFMVALAFIVVERRIRKSWLLAGIAILVLMYPTAKFYRDVVQNRYTLGAVQILSNPGRVMSQLSAFAGSVSVGEYLRDGLRSTGARLDALSALSVIVRDTPERVPYQNGWSVGYIFLSYIPRVLWPDKPETTIGEWVMQTYGSPYDLETDVGPSWVGELYFNFGYLGIVAGMIFLGLLCRLLQETLFRDGATIPALLGACVVLYTLARSVQGGLIRPINGVVYNLPPIVALHFLVRTMGGIARAPRARPGPARP